MRSSAALSPWGSEMHCQNSYAFYKTVLILICVCIHIYFQGKLNSKTSTGHHNTYVQPKLKVYILFLFSCLY
jgi:hypothetical protein